jgi:PKHD-type hydroxylase
MSFSLTPPQNPEAFRQLHGVLTNHDIAEILRYVTAQQTSEGLLGGGRIDHEIRRSKILFLPMDKNTNWLYNKVAKLIKEVNQRDFNFVLDSIQQIQYTEYHATEQGNYDDHLDWSPNILRPRKVSMSIQLTDDHEYKGGDLQIKINANKPIIASRTKGDAFVFPSFLLHGVTPVTEGIRRSLVVWADGPEWK